MKRGNPRLMNLLAVLMVGLTGVLALCYLIILVNPQIFFNPFPPDARSGPVAQVSPTLTPTPTPTSTSALPPTFTPTNTPTITPTPRASATRPPTRTPTPSPTWPPTPTATLRATRAPFPFTCEIEYRRPEYDSWTGVAGQLQDLDGNPVPDYYVRVECPGAGLFTRRAGEESRYNLMYGSDAAWEQGCNPSNYQAMSVRVQLFNKTPQADGSYRAVSDLLFVELGDYASQALGYITCTLNWEELQGP